MIEFQHQFQQLAKVARQKRVPVTLSDTFPISTNRYLPQRMKLAFGTPAPLKFGFHEKIQPSRKDTFSPPRPFRHGLDQAGLLGHPMYNQTGIRQLCQTNDDPARTFHIGNLCHAAPPTTPNPIDLFPGLTYPSLPHGKRIHR